MKTAETEKLVRKDLHAHIYSDALINNLAELKALCRPNVKFCAVVKANAYGHGLTETVNILKNAEVDFFAVASIYEAIHITKLAVKQAILIFEPIYTGGDTEQIILAAKKNFHCTIASVEAAEHICKILEGTCHQLKLHINIETGMGRSGLEPESAFQLIKRIDSAKNLSLAGLYTHFATADEQDLSFTCEQLALFNKFLAETGLNTRKNVIIHAANSAATIKMPQAHFDMVRCGISLYGYFSRPQKQTIVKFEPAMKLQAPIVQLKKIPKGKSISYGRSFITKRDTIAAVIPFGYADGYLRCFSNRAKIKIADSFAPIIGRVCMDQMLIDVTDVPKVSLGQMATIIDDSHNSPSGVYALAEIADTICYEILTCLRGHVIRIVH